MKFGAVAIAEAGGAVLAHAVKHGDLVLKKGRVLGPEDLARLSAAGVAEVVVARLESGDIGEDAAAASLALAIAGAHVRVEDPFTGRANLFADTAGVLTIRTAAIDAVNSVDEAITVATLPNFRAVVAGEMIGTVKIIPFSIPHALAAQAQAALGAASIAVAPFAPKRVAVVSTMLPGLKPSVIDKTLKVMAERLAPAGARIIADRRVPHQAAALAAELRELSTSEADILIMFGASAITDRADVIPAALIEAGGVVEHFGMPVDPGNLLMIGHLGALPVMGAPGCARSPRENGFDWVLQRLLADIPVTSRDIQRMGVGGLLMEIVSRPQPRAVDVPFVPPVPMVSGAIGIIVLAAGRSTRMGAANKLLSLHQGKPLVRHAVEHAIQAAIGPVRVVIGHQAEAVRAALAGLDVEIIANPRYAEGMSTSLQAGIASLPQECAGAMIALGDMPRVGPAILRRLAAIFLEHPEARAIVPTTFGERGNPVMIARALFADVAALSGDIGARKLIDAAGLHVVEVAVDDPGIHLDVDTPDALTALTARGT